MNGSSADRRTLVLAADVDSDLRGWKDDIDRAITLALKGYYSHLLHFFLYLRQYLSMLSYYEAAKNIGYLLYNAILNEIKLPVFFLTRLNM